MKECSFQYERIRQIGEGFFGKVYLVNDPQLGGEFAVKEIPLEDFENDEFATLFAESEAMHASCSENVVSVRTAGRNDHDEVIAIVMPFYKNGSLLDLISKDPLSLCESIQVSQDILAGLEQIHMAGFLHFDLKPSNVLFNDLGKAMVSDFGQASKMNSHAVANAPLMYYLTQPPETITYGRGTVQSDVFQAGLLMYRVVNGEPFFEEQASKYKCSGSIDFDSLYDDIKKGKFPDRRRFQPHVPQSLRRVIQKALKVAPDDRYETATEFRESLGRTMKKDSLDWNMTQIDSETVEWRATPTGKSPLLVRASLRDGDVSVYKEVAKGLQRKNESNGVKLWVKALDKKDTQKHLETVFKNLS